jgi:hypothetical protein
MRILSSSPGPLVQRSVSGSHWLESVPRAALLEHREQYSADQVVEGIFAWPLGICCLEQFVECRRAPWWSGRSNGVPLDSKASLIRGDGSGSASAARPGAPARASAKSAVTRSRA